MKLLLLPADSRRRRLTFFLAMEEWAARSLPAGEYFIVWEVGPTVICGRNQEVDKEVDTAFCRRAGIDICRRRSGGGAVLADGGNLMFSYIAPGEDSENIFRSFTERVAAMLRTLGLNAEAHGRNDIYIGGRKVSGGAFYRLPGRGIAHCTMLHSFDPALMRAALTPARGKLESKGVKSADVSVTSLSAEGLGMSMEEFKTYVLDNVSDSRITLSGADICAIEEIQRRYDDPAFIFGKAATAMPESKARSISTYIAGAGSLTLTITTADDGGGKRIARARLSGDFFAADEGVAAIENALAGCRPGSGEAERRLRQIDVGRHIRGLTADSLLDLLGQCLSQDR